VALKADGTILEIEKEIPVKDLPGVVARALATAYPKATVKKAEEILEFTKDKEVKSYEVVVAEEGKKAVEVKLSTNGEIVKHDDDDEDSD
jgi:hypothetical protein